MNLLKNIFCKKINKIDRKLETYSEQDMNLLEKHIDEHFGNFESVFHEILSPDVHIDICIIPPSEDKEYYTLVTIGMGAHKMNVPKKLRKYNLERAELVVYLPKDWIIGDEREEFYWPLKWLKEIGRLPINQNTWIGYGHTISNEGPFANNTELSGILLLNACGNKEGSEKLILTNKNVVNFYQMFPLYDEEMEYKIENGSNELMDILDIDNLSRVIDIKRKMKRFF